MARGTWTAPLARVDVPRSAEFQQQRSIAFPWLARFPRQALLALLVAVAYYFGTRIGLALTPHELPIATFWPPNAILLAALLLSPRGMWWKFLLAVFPAHLLVQLPAGIPFATAGGWFISNSVEALLGAACVRHFKKPGELFESVPGVLVFLVFAVLLAPLASSFVDAGVVVTTGFGSGYWKLWTARQGSNMLADLTVAPTIVVWTLNGRRWLQHVTRWRIVEASLVAVGVVVVSSVVFGTGRPTITALMYSPLLVWTVVRFGVGGLYPSLLAISMISFFNVTHGRNPFVPAPMAESVLGIQMFLCTIALPMMLLAAVLAERKTAEKSLRKSKGKLLATQEQERRRIARELHDDIGQQLSILAVELDRLSRDSDENLKPQLDKLYRQACTVSDATRAISHGLHPAQLELLGLVPAVRSLCGTVAQEAAIEVTFTESNIPIRLDPQISLCLYRVTQEALHNIARHSHARKVGVQLHGKGERIVLDIADDGVGFIVKRKNAGTLGLASMQERVSLVGGTFRLASRPMRGTKIEAIVPLRGVGSRGSLQA